jgi:RNA polymerase II subunit A small phosphatase-like protein
MTRSSDKLVILDIDETLIHATKVALNQNCHFRVDEYFVYERPDLKSFLTELSHHFSIGLWSSADDAYVAEIASQIKPQEVDFVIVWGRSKCSFKHNAVFDTYCYEKRLDKLKKKGFKLEQILIVDDSPEKSRTNYGNAIQVKPFTGDPNDKELQHLYHYLLSLKTVENVRTIEKRGWDSNAAFADHPAYKS